jgi:nucleoside-diphosphate-sugar epimerase
MSLRRIAVTGAAGFLGHHLIDAAQRRGLEALSIVRSAVPTADTVAMSDLLATPSRLDGTDVLVHAAAVRHRHGASADSYRASNIDLVEALLRAAAGRVGRFVFVSSVGVYGWPRRLPVTEANPFAPVTLYSWTKVEAEKRVARLAKELGVSYTIVRPTIIYGTGDTNGMLDKLTRMIAARRYLIVGSGANTLHHTHVDDVVAGIFALAESDAARDEHFIVAGPETITLAKLSELVATACGRSIPRLHVPLPFARAAATAIDVAAWHHVGWTEKEPPINNEKLDVMTLDIAFDPAKAAAAGFVPRVRYEEGIRRTFGAAA